MSSPPTGTVTFLFTDVEGSTRLWERSPEAMSDALARHDRILRGAIEAKGGFVFKTVGDAFCAAFGSATDALEASLLAQRELLAEGWPEDVGTLRVRMALHSGAAEERDGDYFGPPVNRVARLLSAGHGGQTLTSNATKELVAGGLRQGMTLRDLGERHLKDLFRPERVFQLSAPELPSGFPPLKTLDARRNNLSPQTAPLVGRELEVEKIRSMMRQGTRLLTLTGPGGTGKTRLALQAAAELLDEHEDGAFFVSLAATMDSELFFVEVAGALGVTEGGDTPLSDLLKEYLSRRELLLVLDNFEQLLSAAPLVGEILSAAPRVKILATSRIPLGVYGEREYAVPPLDVPDPGGRLKIEELSRYEAVRLFVERAVAVKAGFTLTEENAPAIAEICVRLDGLPLAIELAAARIKLLPPKALLTRLANRLKLLKGGARDLPERQRTLRGAIDWSHDLLDQGEKVLFARLAVFSGGRTLEAIGAICDAEGDLSVDSLDGVSSLLNKSLIKQEERPEEEPRFVMLETIHEYAREKLQESGEADAVKRAHAKYFLSLADEARPELVGPEQVEWMDRLEAEHGNLRSAISWALDREDAELALRFCGALWWFWSVRGHWREGLRWLGQGLSKGEAVPQRTRAEGLLAAGALVYKGGDFESSARSVEEALTLYKQAGDRRGTATCLGYLGTTWIDRGNWEKAEALLEESLALAREARSSWDMCSALNELSVLAAYRGNLERANHLAEEGLAVAKRAGDTYTAAAMYGGLASAAMLGGDYKRAETLLEENLELLRVTRNRVLEANALNNLALISLRRGDHERTAALASRSLEMSDELLDRFGVSVSLDALAAVCGKRGNLRGAARLWAAAEALRQSMDIPRPPDDEKILEPFVSTTRSDLDEATWDAAWGEGRAMDLEEAVARGLEVGFGGAAVTGHPLPGTISQMPW